MLGVGVGSIGGTRTRARAKEVMDGSPLLGGRARSASSTTWTTLGALGALGALALTTRGAWKGQDATLEEALRYMPPYPQNPPGAGTPITYTLHVGCESSRVRSYNPTFWNSDIVEARIVRHNYPGGKFFEWDDGLVMTNLANLQPGDTKTFELQTNQLNYEYGFALKNANGDIHYEVGAMGTGPISGSEGNCTTAFGKWHNRIITNDYKRSEYLGFVDATFGECNANCMPANPDSPWDWSDTDKAKATQVMKTQPPKGLNARFMMFGQNSGGICTLNLHTQRGTCDDILVHFDPRPKTNNFITDNLRCGVWQGQYVYLPWSDEKMGSVNENDDTRWKFVFQYHTDGLNIELNGEQYAKYAWNSQDGGYNTVSYIQIEFDNRKHYRQGAGYPLGSHGCSLVAMMPPRTPLGAAAFTPP